MNMLCFFGYNLIYSCYKSLILLKGGHTHPTNSYFPLEKHILR